MNPGIEPSWMTSSTEVIAGVSGACGAWSMTASTQPPTPSDWNPILSFSAIER